MQTWRTLTEIEIPNLIQFVRDNTREGQSVHIGTDSLQKNLKTQFVTVVCILQPLRGGRVAYTKESVPRIQSLRERLLREVQRSVDLAMVLSPVIKGDLTVAIDANPVIKYRSSLYLQELVGYVVGQGFQVAVKPDSWAATHCADHAVRVLGK